MDRLQYAPTGTSPILLVKVDKEGTTGVTNHPIIGTIGWVDLTVTYAEVIRDFYRKVVGWQPKPVEMGENADFNKILPTTGQPAAGVCHAPGVNAKIPVVWLIYITVADLDESLKACLELGGEVIDGPRGEPGEGRIVVIRDPAGAVCALWEAAA